MMPMRLEPVASRSRVKHSNTEPLHSLLVVIKLEFNLKLKIKRKDWLLADTCQQAANHCALFESETVLKFYNLEARSYPNRSAQLQRLARILKCHLLQI